MFVNQNQTQRIVNKPRNNGCNWENQAKNVIVIVYKKCVKREWHFIQICIGIKENKRQKMKYLNPAKFKFRSRQWADIQIQSRIEKQERTGEERFAENLIVQTTWQKIKLQKNEPSW